MARYTGPKCRLCRREGIQLYLKGERCHTAKCALSRRGDQLTPGMHGMKRAKKGSEYGTQMREKQRLKRIFGLLERQFRVAFARAQQQRGNTGQNLLVLVQRRLDFVVRQGGFAYGPNSARQMATHGLFYLNGRRVDVPSIALKAGDVITVAPRERAQKLAKTVLEATKAYHQVPSWLERDEEKLTLKVLTVPTREEFPTLVPIREQLIVEGASK